MKKLWFFGVCVAAILVSCPFDVGDVNISKKTSDPYTDPFKKIDFLADLNPLVFGTSTNNADNSIVLGGSEDVPEGSIELRSINGKGKIAGSEDAGAYYFREVDVTKNFRLSATFKVLTFGNTTTSRTSPDAWTEKDTNLSPNGQEAWGILVQDFIPQWSGGKTMSDLKNTPLTTRNSSAYNLGTTAVESNMILVGGIKRGVRVFWREGVKYNSDCPLTDGNPSATVLQNTTAFRQNWTPRELGDYSIYTYNGTPTVAARPDFPPKNSEWKLSLEKTNNGFKYVIEPPPEVLKVAEDNDLDLYPDNGKLTGSIPLYDIVSSVNTQHYYVGFFAAREATIWVNNIEYYEADSADCAPAVPAEPAAVNAALEVLSPSVYTGNDYLYVKSNIKGSLTVSQDGKQIPMPAIVNEWIVEKDNGAAKPCTLFTVPTYPHKDGDNIFNMIFYPEGRLPAEFGDGYELSSDAAIRTSFVVTKKLYHNGTGDIWVSPAGNARGGGTMGSPLNLQTAIDHVQPGQTIVLQNGVYNMNELFVIARYNNGRSGAPKTLKAETRDGVFFDWNRDIRLRDKGQAFLLAGNYWVLDGFHVRNSPDNTKGIVIGGKNNIVRWVSAYSNGDTGLQISGDSKDPKAFWPSGNRIEYCESFNNYDSSEINADGFAAKLTAGRDNEFYRCISHNNCDDGWDLFSKKDTGTIGAVKITECISYENGTVLYAYRKDGSRVENYFTKGGKNGFKMGGEGLAISHELRDSLSFRNGYKEGEDGADGIAVGNAITSNSNPALLAYNCTAINGKGDAPGVITIYSGDKTDPTGKAKDCVYAVKSSDKFDSGSVNAVPANTDFESVMVSREIDGVSYKKFLERDANGKPILKDVYKPAAKGAQALY